LPNPADADAAYWLARALWALGEGYATFRAIDPAFAHVLSARIDLAMTKLDAELVTPNYGRYYVLHGYQTPKWLISDGADASSEAMLGLAAYYGASRSVEAAKLAQRFGGGIAGYQLGTAREWAWQALMPWARSLSDWHAWGAHMVMALATAGLVLGQRDWVSAAERDVDLFETHQQLSFGPINGLLPAPDDRSQIAYGAETTVDGLLSLGHATGKTVYPRLAGIAAGWFLGDNPAGAMMYQPASGVVYDGINADGSINHNSGAESTIEGLLALMNAVHDPVARAYLRYHNVAAHISYQKVEAESGSRSGHATVVTPASAWTDEALWSHGAYVDLASGSSDSVAVTAPADGRYLVYIVFDKQMAPAGAVGITVSVDGTTAGRDDEGGAGAQGDAPHPDYLWIDSVAAPRVLRAGPHTVTLTYAGNGSTDAKIDAILLQPVAESKVLTDGRGGTLAIYKSLAARTVKAQLPALAPARKWMVQVYDRNGNVVAMYPLHPRPDGATVVPVLAYGCTLAVRAVERRHLDNTRRARTGRWSETPSQGPIRAQHVRQSREWKM
jgi:hypothetical protein